MKSLANFIKLSIVIVYLACLIGSLVVCCTWLSNFIVSPAHSATKAAMIRIAVVDTGLDVRDSRFKGKICPESKDFTGKGLEDTIGHGTHIASIIMQYAGNANYCLLILKAMNKKHNNDLNFYLDALKYAKEQKVNIVNLSLYGDETCAEELTIIQSMPWAVFVAAAGNDGIEIGKGNERFPASYHLKNLITVGALTPEGNRAVFSNYGPDVQVWENGYQDAYLPKGKRAKLHGTSQAAAVLTGKMVGGKAFSDLFRQLPKTR